MNGTMRPSGTYLYVNDIAHAFDEKLTFLGKYLLKKLFSFTTKFYDLVPILRFDAKV